MLPFTGSQLELKNDKQEDVLHVGALSEGFSNKSIFDLKIVSSTFSSSTYFYLMNVLTRMI